MPCPENKTETIGFAKQADSATFGQAFVGQSYSISQGAAQNGSRNGISLHE